MKFDNSPIPLISTSHDPETVTLCENVFHVPFGLKSEMNVVFAMKSGDVHEPLRLMPNRPEPWPAGGAAP